MERGRLFAASARSGMAQSGRRWQISRRPWIDGELSHSSTKGGQQRVEHTKANLARGNSINRPYQSTVDDGETARRSEVAWGRVGCRQARAKWPLALASMERGLALRDLGSVEDGSKQAVDGEAAHDNHGGQRTEKWPVRLGGMQIQDNVKIHGSSPLCTICGKNSDFTKEDFQKFDYENFTQSPMSGKSAPNVNLLPESARITCRYYKKQVDSGKPHLLLDVRPAHHFQITSISQSLNIPLLVLEEKLPTLQTLLLKDSREASVSNKLSPIYVVCRRGNDSQRAVQLLGEKGFLSAKDIIGGLQLWAQDVDPDFPVYQ
ncbi:adenylyltransferase and sulfurtransferase MOCS3-1-like [Phragmites australis]|uniref:adenylyltransferase and sulfurtransferase MOCS3-1-like n=1 Tax=Phragmites australis TaxID=29695 RepID=UPI002D789939|nr:adenylyltransferase and sulfurtransferase MOCS3-1-like [Phragmites australis]